MNHPKDHRFGAHCLADAWQLDQIHQQIETSAGWLQNLLNQHINLTQKNKDSFITSTAYIRQAENLLYVAQTTLIHPIKP